MDYRRVYLEALKEGVRSLHTPARSRWWHVRRRVCTCGWPSLPCPVLATRLDAVDRTLRPVNWRTTSG